MSAAKECIEALERTRAQTLKHFELPERDLARTYGPGKWSVRYILSHLADSESVLYYRVRMIISEPKPVIWYYDQDAWAKHLDYSTVPLELSRRLFDTSREAILYQARAHYEKSGDNEYIHSKDGLKTLKQQFASVADHNQHHLDQIVQALKG